MDHICECRREKETKKFFVLQKSVSTLEAARKLFGREIVNVLAGKKLAGNRERFVRGKN
jgi:hypothetical protein